MYRRKKKTTSFAYNNLEVLMDILTNTVGALLFVVLFWVIQARGVRVAVSTPIAQDAPEKMDRKLFLCQKGTVRFLDTSEFWDVINKVIKKKGVTYDNIPDIVKEVNKKNMCDDYFTYKMDYFENNWGYYSHREGYILIDVKDGAKGESIEDIKTPSSNIISSIDKLDKESVWICLQVDNESLELFRKLREICFKKDFITGWDPLKMEFPYKLYLSGSEYSSGQSVQK